MHGKSPEKGERNKNERMGGETVQNLRSCQKDAIPLTHFPNSQSVLLKKQVFLLIPKDCSRKLQVFASLRSLSQGHLFMKNKWAFITESG